MSNSAGRLKPHNTDRPTGNRQTKIQNESSKPLAKTFDDLGLSQALLDAVKSAGYTDPTPIQQEAIPAVLMNRDVLGLAQTGTGKTASFTLPMIEILSQGRARARMPRSLILTPTRELAAQVAESFEKYGANHSLTMALLIGGVSFEEQDRKLDRGVDVLIATPGRLLDQFERGKVLLTGVQVMVVDEADRMLDMGFIPDIERIFKLTPFTRQTLFFSATMPKEIERITNTFLHNPVRVEVARPSTTVDNITQKLVPVSGDFKAKRHALRELLKSCEVTNGIIFCNRKRDVDVVAKSLSAHGFSASPLHGDLDQSVRIETLDKFRNGECTFLVASDVAARGLDIPAVSHVFNFDVPIQAEDYVHRIGRTGRAGRSGEAFTLFGSRDDKAVAAIEKQIGRTLDRLTLEASAADQSDTDDDSNRKSSDNRRSSKRGARDDRQRSNDRSKPRNQHNEAADDQPGEKNDKPRDRSRGRSNKNRDKDDRNTNERVVGLGDHTPAFLQRPVPHLKAADAKGGADGDSSEDPTETPQTTIRYA